jgi:hypothetical protein
MTKPATSKVDHRAGKARRGQTSSGAASQSAGARAERNGKPRRRKAPKRPTPSESYFVALLAEQARHPSIANPVAIDDLCDKLAGYLDAEQIALVRDAYDYAARAHEGQWRRTGHAYISHPLAVANILADMRMDHVTVMAALLHDVIEDTDVARGNLGDRYGESVAQIVDGVSKLSTIFRTRAEAQAENFQKMALAHGQGHSRDRRQAGGPAPQHAHHRRDVRRAAQTHRPRDPRLLRPHRQPAWHPSHQGRVRGVGLPCPLSAARRPYRTCREGGARQPQGADGRAAQVHRLGARPGGNPGRSPRPREAPLLHLPEDEGSAQIVRRDHGRVRLPRGGGQRRRLLPGPRRRPQPLQAGRRALQGLHRHSQGQRLSVVAHHPVRHARGAHRGADPHPPHGGGGRERYRRTLAVQDRDGRFPVEPAAGPSVGARPARAAAEGGQPAGVHRKPEDRPVSRRGVRLHPQGPHHGAAPGAPAPWTSLMPSTPT